MDRPCSMDSLRQRADRRPRTSACCCSCSCRSGWRWTWPRSSGRSRPRWPLPSSGGRAVLRGLASPWDSSNTGERGMFHRVPPSPPRASAITARVFVDLRALATTGRVVLGAAVADDVLGLLILTVVVKVVTGGDVSAVSILGTIGAAIGFLVIATAAGIFTVPSDCGESNGGRDRRRPSSSSPSCSSWHCRVSASWANLAPIIGAFVAGLAIGRSDHHARIERDFGAVANVLIPVFFVQIGLDADHRRYGQTGSAGPRRSPARCWHRRQTGVGRRNRKPACRSGCSSHRDDPPWRGRDHLCLNRARRRHLRRRPVRRLLIVILVTTLITPPLLRWRIAAHVSPAAAGDLDGDGTDEWDIAVVGDRIVLRGRPPTGDTVPVALDVARLAPLATPTRRSSTGSGRGRASVWGGARPIPKGSSTCCARATRAACASSMSPESSTGRCPRSARRWPADAPTPVSSIRREFFSSRQCSASVKMPTARHCSPPSSPTCARPVRRDPPSRWPPASTRPPLLSSTAVPGPIARALRPSQPRCAREASILQLADTSERCAVDAAHDLAARPTRRCYWLRRELDRSSTGCTPVVAPGSRRCGDALDTPRGSDPALAPPEVPALGWKCDSWFLCHTNPRALPPASLVGGRPRRGVAASFR